MQLSYAAVSLRSSERGDARRITRSEIISVGVRELKAVRASGRVIVDSCLLSGPVMRSISVRDQASAGEPWWPLSPKIKVSRGASHG